MHEELNICKNNVYFMHLLIMQYTFCDCIVLHRVEPSTLGVNNSKGRMF